MTDEEIARSEYHLKHMKMSALRVRIETLSAAVNAISNYCHTLHTDKEFEDQLYERIGTAIGVLSDLMAEYCDIVQCTEICHMDDVPDLEVRRDE